MQSMYLIMFFCRVSLCHFTLFKCGQIVILMWVVCEFSKCILYKAIIYNSIKFENCGNKETIFNYICAWRKGAYLWIIWFEYYYEIGNKSDQLQFIFQRFSLSTNINSLAMYYITDNWFFKEQNYMKISSWNYKVSLMMKIYQLKVVVLVALRRVVFNWSNKVHHGTILILMDDKKPYSQQAVTFCAHEQRLQFVRLWLLQIDSK